MMFLRGVVDGFRVFLVVEARRLRGLVLGGLGVFATRFDKGVGSDAEGVRSTEDVAPVEDAGGFEVARIKGFCRGRWAVESGV